MSKPAADPRADELRPNLRSSARSGSGVRTGPAAGNLATAYLSFVAVFMLYTSYLVISDHQTVPHLDDWRVLDTFFSNPFSDWLFSEQNGHRLPVTFLLFALDYTYLGGRQDLLVVASVGCATLALGALYFGLRTDDDHAAALPLTSFGFACFALLWAGTCHDFRWGLNQGSQLVVLWLCVCLSSAMRYRNQLERGVPRSATRWVVVAGVSAVFSTFSHGIGFATWAALLAASIVAKFPLRVLAVFTAGGGFSVAVYSIGIKSSVAELAMRVWDHPLDLLTATLAFVGMAIGWIAQGLGVSDTDTVFNLSAAAGAIGLLVFAALASLSWARPKRPRSRDLIAMGLMAFPIAGGAMAVLNRVGFGAQMLTELRFVTWSTLFWMGAALAIPSLASNIRRRSQAVVVVATALLSFSMIPGLISARSAHATFQRRLTATANAHLLGIQTDRQARNFVQPRPDQVNRVVARLRRDRRSFFADPRAELPGTRMLDRLELSTGADCNGAIRGLRPIPTQGQPAASIGGWGSNQNPSDVPSFVVIADPDGIVAGLGAFNLAARERAGRPSKDEFKSYSWRGYIADFDPSKRYVVYGVLSEGRTVCRLAATK